jgi:PhnB protein
VDLAERLLGSADLHLYNAELWAKYAGAVDYEQVHHRDFVNHSLVVPSRGDPGRQMTLFVLLSDVDEDDGPTKVVPLDAGGTRPYWPKGGDEDFARRTGIEPGAFADAEVSVTGPAGTYPSENDLIMHGQLDGPNGLTLMGADTPKDMEYRGLSSVSISVSGDDEPTLRGYWDKLTEGGNTVQPLEVAPWGDAFGMVVDRFGLTWLVNITGAAA